MYEFSSEYTVKFASLILGLLEIEGDYLLMYVENVYLQPPFPPTHIGVYQIATIDYLQYSRVVTNRALKIINALKTVTLSTIQEIFNFSFYFSFERDINRK